MFVGGIAIDGDQPITSGCCRDEFNGLPTQIEPES
jgi:hypothetical protein